MLFFLPLVTASEKPQLICTYCIEKYANLVSKSLITSVEWVFLSGFLLFKGSSNKTISLCIILCLIFMIFFDQIANYLTNALKNDTFKFPFMKKIYESGLDFLKFWDNKPFIAVGIVLVISYYISKLLDLSLLIYISYLLANIIDSAKLMYLGEYQISSGWYIMIISVIIVFYFFKFLKTAIYSLFYSIVGSTLFIISVETLINSNSKLSTMYIMILRENNFRDCLYCLILQFLIIVFSVWVQVRNEYK
ncbi:hypothetical protein NBO_24g0008 [Nosema bombycis CQ1]|uniref:Uncharacterized protein n=1 Tax=Nosema bombycis (strain CQ1 / CVCC 102059) TaxID=578461 RepID=R0KWG6_NOSB1|nr:hypothetical protein NBO_24g0008 [Nosema bombycis CQ1]|eukprot:EOB14562.1 hypothetical protein NBO_24g0008 [Nosema bombycis CQ1]